MSRKRDRRHGSFTTTVDVDVDVDIAEVLSELSDEDLREELRERGATIAKVAEDWPERVGDMLSDLREVYDTRDGIHFSVLLIRLETLLLERPAPLPMRKEPAA